MITSLFKLASSVSTTLLLLAFLTASSRSSPTASDPPYLTNFLSYSSSGPLQNQFSTLLCTSGTDSTSSLKLDIHQLLRENVGANSSHSAMQTYPTLKHTCEHGS